jgi:phosphopantetheinyl transferase (holo-ACP synthase)
MGGSSSNSSSNRRRSDNNAANELERINKQRQERLTSLVRQRLNNITCTTENNDEHEQQQQQQQQPSSCFRANLFLLDVSNEVHYDPDANHLRNRIEQHLQKNNAYSANKYFLSTTKADFDKEIITSTADADAVEKSILRFLKTQDKYTSFVSILLKSQAFYEIYDNNNNNNNFDNAKQPDDDENQNQTRQQQRHNRPVIDLPRTKYKKPYIPLPHDYWSSNSRMDDNNDESSVKVICATNTSTNNNNDNTNEENESRIQEEDIFSFSISHQFPFVGMAQIGMHHDNKIPCSPPVSPPAVIIVGLDIVTFDDDMIKRLYSNSLDEFLNVFRDSFTKNEWNIGIQDPTLTLLTSSSNTNNDNGSKLKEFYIRWSMKEAYTKAIGIGMGLEFNSFEIYLQQEENEIINDDNNNNNDDNQNNDDNNQNENTSMKSVWNRIVVSQQQQQRDNNSSNDSDYMSMPTPSSRPTCFHGRIRFLKNNKDRDDEFFLFYFLPLQTTKRHMSVSSSKSSSTVPNQTATKAQEGCACVCVGSRSFQGKPSFTTSWRNDINISWTEIDQLLEVHHH